MEPTKKVEFLPLRSRKGVVGVLLGDDSDHVVSEDTSIELGYRIPMMWYPKSKSQLLPPIEKRVEDSAYARARHLLQLHQPHQEIGIRFPASRKVTVENKVDLTCEDLTNAFTLLSKVDELEVEITLKSIIATINSSLERVIKEEMILGKALEKVISKNRLKLPIHFLMEKGLEVDWCRNVIKDFFTIFFQCVGRPPVRQAFQKWYNFVSEQRYIELLQQAGIEKLRMFMARMILFKYQKFWRTWLHHNIEIEKAKRRNGAIAMQRIRRGQLGRRAFKYHSERWYASRRIQTCFRMWVKLKAYVELRNTIIYVESFVRKWKVEKMIRLWNRSTTMIQKHVRMKIQYRIFQELKRFTIQIQYNYRGRLGRKRFQVECQKSMYKIQYEWFCSSIIQKFWRQYSTRLRLWKIKRNEEIKIEAALTIQRFWYSIKEQFHSFVLMRALVIEDMRDVLIERKAKCAVKHEKIIQIQCMVRCVKAKQTLNRHILEYVSSTSIQRIGRGVVARNRVTRFKRIISYAVRIQRCFRSFSNSVHCCARKLQRLWWNYSKGALLRRIRRIREERIMIDIKKQHYKIYEAVVKIQTLSRSISANKQVSIRRANLLLQRVTRGFLGCLKKERWRVILIKRASTHFVNSFLKKMHMKVSYNMFCLQKESACKIQSFYRRKKAVEHFKILRHEFIEKGLAARTIQCNFRIYQSRKLFHKLHSRNHMRRKNRYKSIESISQISQTAILHARAFFDPFDEFAGMHIGVFLHRLHLQEYYGLFKSKHIGDLFKLMNANVNFLKRVGIQESSHIDTIIQMLKVVNMNDQQAKGKNIQTIEYEEDIREANEKFQVIRDKKYFLDFFIAHFPDQSTRAANFAERMPVNSVNRFQLERHFRKYSGRPKEAKNYADEMLQLDAGISESQRQWQIIRMRKCFAIYEMAVERIRDVIKGPSWLISIIDHNLASARLLSNYNKKRGCCDLRICLNLAIQASNAAVLMQNLVRKKLAARIFAKLLMAKRYRDEIQGGSLLKKRWNEERELERVEWQKYFDENMRYEREKYLSTVIRFGWDEIWDDQYQAYYYYCVLDGNISWEKQIYTYVEDQETILIQKYVRRMIAKALRTRLGEQKRRHEELTQERKAWESLQHERDNLMTFRLNVAWIPTEDIEAANTDSSKAMIEAGITLSWRKRWIPIVNSESHVNSILKHRTKAKEDWSRAVSIKENITVNLDKHKLELQQVLNKRQRGTCKSNQDNWFMWIESNKHISIDQYNKTEHTNNLIANYQVVEKDKELKLQGLKNWKTARDEKGRLYYFDIKTSTTSWEVPEEILQQILLHEHNRQETDQKLMEDEDKETLEWKTEHRNMTDEDMLARARKRLTLEIENLSHLMSFKIRDEVEETGKKRHWKTEKAIKTEFIMASKIQALVRGNVYRKKLYQDSLIKKITNLENDAINSTKEVIRRKHYLASLLVGVVISSRFTMVDIPYGWNRHRDGYGRYFYSSEFTGETVWKKPIFVWEEEHAARIVQHVYRGRQGKRRFNEYLMSLNISEIGGNSLKTVSSMAWIGKGSSGITVKMWFARHGLFGILRNITETKANKTKQLERAWEQIIGENAIFTENKLKSVHIVEKRHIDRVLSVQTLLSQLNSHDIDDKPETCTSWLDFIRDSRPLVSMFLHCFPNQQARALRFSQQVKSSETPVTFLQVRLHLEKYNLKPSLACVQVEDELANQPTISPPSKCKEVRLRLQSALNRICIVLSNMKISSVETPLRRCISQSSSIVDRVARGESFPPGPYYTKLETPIEAARAFRLYEGVKEAIHAENNAVTIQRLYRDYKNLLAWREIATRFREACKTVQRAWRCYWSRCEYIRRYEMFHSSWEELFDENEGIFYYFDNNTNNSQWQKPKVRYRPFKWWPPDPDEIPPPEGICSKCREFQATKQCNECYFKNGDRKQFCFKCFAIVHSNHRDLLSHGYITLGIDDGNKEMPCVQCLGPSLRHCEDCKESFCMSCYRRFHSKGKRKSHSWIIYEESVFECVDCEGDIATVRCNDCQDMFCETCSVRIHSKGVRTNHKIESIEYTIRKHGQGM